MRMKWHKPVSICLLLLLYLSVVRELGTLGNSTQQANTTIDGIEATDPVIIQVSEVSLPQPKIFNIEARNGALYLLGGETSGECKLYEFDGGNSWEFKYDFAGFAPPTWGHGFYVTENGTILLYVKNLTAGTYKMFRSGDDGNTFTEIGTELPADKRWWKAAEDLSGNIYIGLYPTYPWVYKSSDNGQTWNIFWNGTPYGEYHIHALKTDPYTGAIWIGTGDVNPLIVNTYNGGSSFNISRVPTLTAFGFTSRYVLTGKDAAKNLVYDKISDTWRYWFTREKDYYSNIFGLRVIKRKSISGQQPAQTEDYQLSMFGMKTLQLDYSEQQRNQHNILVLLI